MIARRGLLAAVAIAFLAGGCVRATEGGPSADLSGGLDDGGVTVVAVATLGPDGIRQLSVTFTPQEPGFHLYSIDLPANGVAGLGIPTRVNVHGSLRTVGSPTADVPVKTLRIEELDVDLPVYPDGPVTITVPVERTGDGLAEVVVTYGACSPSACLPPVRDRAIALRPPTA